jgi:hypothetical protein
VGLEKAWQIFKMKNSKEHVFRTLCVEVLEELVERSIALRLLLGLGFDNFVNHLVPVAHGLLGAGRGCKIRKQR